MRIFVLMILSISLVFIILSACGDNGNNKQAVTRDPTKSSVASVTFSINTTTPNVNKGSAVAKALQEKTGVSFDYQTVTGGKEGSDQKYMVWLASGDYPDIVNFTSEITTKYKEGDAIIPLEELIEKYGPNIKRKFGKYYDLLKDRDGHIWSIYIPNIATETPTSQASFVVQYEVLKEAGYPEITTLDELFTLLQSYVGKYPKVDGKDVIAFSGVGPSLTYINTPIAAAGYPNHGQFIVDKNNELHMAVIQDFAKDYYKFLNHLQLSGMLDKEIFTLNWESASAKMAQGRVLAAFVPRWILKNVESSLMASGSTNRLYAKFPLLLNNSYEDHQNVILPTLSADNWSITKNAKTPERVIQLIDFLFTDEGQKLIGWGIENEDYTLKDGIRTRTQEYIDGKSKDGDLYDATRGLITAPYVRFSFGDGAKLDDGDYATPINANTVADSYDEDTKQVLGIYGKKIWADFLPKPEYIPGYIWQLTGPSGLDGVQKSVEQIISREVPEVIMAPNRQEFNLAWDSFVSKMDKAGTPQLEQAWTGIWKSYIEQYNKVVNP